MKGGNQMRKLGILCLALVITLGTFGVGYATWSDNVTVEETVFSGTWEVELTGSGYDLGDTCEDATCDVSIDSAKTLTVDIEDAPPCCSGNITFTIDNVGTIPVKITKVEFIAPDDGNWGTVINDLPNPFDEGDPIELPPCTRYFFDLYGDSAADLSLHLQPGLIGQQIDPPGGAPDHVDGKINFHVEAGASDNLTTHFDLEFEAVPCNL
jgi:hypothetical protein